MDMHSMAQQLSLCVYRQRRLHRDYTRAVALCPLPKIVDSQGVLCKATNRQVAVSEDGPISLLLASCGRT